MACKRVVSPSSSSDGVEVVKEVSAPAGASSSKPRTYFRKWRFVSLDEEEDEEFLTREARKRILQPCSPRGDAVEEPSASLPGRKSPSEDFVEGQGGEASPLVWPEASVSLGGSYGTG